MSVHPIQLSKMAESTRTWIIEGLIIKDKEHYSKSMGKLCMTDTYSDLTLISQEGTRFPAHRDILAGRSEYFSALLYGGLKESSEKEVNVLCCDKVLKPVLTFLYSGEVHIGSIEVSFLMSLISETRRMIITNLQEAVEDIILRVFMFGMVNIKKAIEVFNLAEETDFKDIANGARKCLEEKVDEILDTVEYMQGFTISSLTTFLTGDDLDVSEIEIFRAVASYLEAAEITPENKKAVLSVVRLDQMTIKQLIKEVQLSGLFSDSQVLKAISLEEGKVSSRKVILNRNICLKDMGAKVMTYTAEPQPCYCPRFGCSCTIDVLISGKKNGHDYSMNDEYVMSKLGQRLEIELPSKQKINKINILFHDREVHDSEYVKQVHKEYSYKIESSLNGMTWELIADFSNYKGKSWQTIYFEDKRMKYIGIVGIKEYRKENRMSSSPGPVCLNETPKNHIHVTAIEAILDTNTEDKDRKNAGMKRI